MIFLLNDVHCEMDASNLVVGDSDSPSSELGNEQASKIGSNIGSHLHHIDEIVASKASRLSKLIHTIRVKSKDGYLTKAKVRYLDSLKERSFGVLNGSRINIHSELFGHTRIMAEDGESIYMVRRRMMEVIDSLKCDSRNVLMVSHPFSCQILFNALMGVSHVMLTSFWFKKGALAVIDRKSGWKLVKAVNVLDESDFSLEKICSNLVQ